MVVRGCDYKELNLVLEQGLGLATGESWSEGFSRNTSFCSPDFSRQA